MPRQCSICNHAESRAITADLMNGASYRNVAKRYALSSSSIDRHLRLHVSQALRKIAAHQARESESMTVGDAVAIAEPVFTVLDETRKLYRHMYKVLIDAAAADDKATLMQANRECVRDLDLIARITGELDPRAGGETGSGPINVTIQYNRAVVVAPEGPTGQPVARKQITAGEASCQT
jgi:hypothetical protein